MMAAVGTPALEPSRSDMESTHLRPGRRGGTTSPTDTTWCDGVGYANWRDTAGLDLFTGE